MNDQVDQVVAEGIVLPEIPVQREAQTGDRPVYLALRILPPVEGCMEGLDYGFRVQVFNFKPGIVEDIVVVIQMPGGLEGIAVDGKNQKKQQCKCPVVLSATGLLFLALHMEFYLKTVAIYLNYDADSSLVIWLTKRGEARLSPLCIFRNLFIITASYPEHHPWLPNRSLPFCIVRSRPVR